MMTFAVDLGPEHNAKKSKATPGIFNSVQVKKKGLKPFPKWTGTLERFILESKKNEGTCTPSKKKKCHYTTWANMVAKLKDADLIAKVKGVNCFMNKAPYVVDKMNWVGQGLLGHTGAVFHQIRRLRRLCDRQVPFSTRTRRSFRNHAHRHREGPQPQGGARGARH
jgi:hypothetical protein